MAGVQIGVKFIRGFWFNVVVSTLAQKTNGATWMKASGPILEGRIALEPNRSWHIGGFCFGHTADETDREVGFMTLKFGLHGSTPLDKGVLFFAAWGDHDLAWGDAKRKWHSSSCMDKLSSAPYHRDLHDFNLQPSLDSSVFYSYTVGATVLQHMSTKDWHFGFVACEDLTLGANALFYEVHSSQGALSMFDANDMDPKSCPILPSEWLQEAKAHSSFWLMLLGCTCIGAVPCCAISACLLFRARMGDTKKGQELPQGHDLPLSTVVGQPVSGIEDGNASDSWAQGVPPHDDKSHASPQKVLVSPESAGPSPYCKV
eukprot:TRINITY_DN269_c0_g2_i2.p1 TRINITY_DN269_c0_g2~~TRINITY_DN269_c0_g2_i2.p1  ORF type:complete len:316 (+),score=45.41 TRINITY_DN269_c0_g2_i2:68-1015(+)